jgi:hypothetical protein
MTTPIVLLALPCLSTPMILNAMPRISSTKPVVDAITTRISFTYCLQTSQSFLDSEMLLSARGMLHFHTPLTRSDKQHRLLELAVGGLYPAQELVESILQPRPNARPTILDLGIVPLS